MEVRTLKFVIEACAGRLLNGSEKTPISRVCTDSRQAQAGDLFLALRGERFDGHKFLDVAISAEAQLLNAQEAFIGPSNSKVKLEGFLAENLPYGETLKKMVPPDWNKMDQVRNDWTEHWNREIR